MSQPFLHRNRFRIVGLTGLFWFCLMLFVKTNIVNSFHRISSLLGWGLALLLAGCILFFLMFGQSLWKKATFSFGSKKRVEKNHSSISLHQMAGYEEAKQELIQLIDFLKNPSYYQKLGCKLPKGILLVGPPGTGKTLLARILASEAQVPFFSVSAAEFVEMYVGIGAARVRDLFAQAQIQSPCIVFIDELDAIGRTRSAAQRLDPHEEREQTLNQLLIELDGFSQNGKTVLVVAATNRPETLDPALLRAGRFDKRITLDLPSTQDRLAILQIHAKQLPLHAAANLEQMASQTAGFSGADLASLLNESALQAARRRATEIHPEDLQAALERQTMGLTYRSKRLSAAEKKRLAYHECGHTVVAALLAPARQFTIHKISLFPPTHGSLGHLSIPPGSLTNHTDSGLWTEPELRNHMVALLAGRAAEEIWQQDFSTGSQTDLQQATLYANHMITKWGMSQSLGLQSFATSSLPIGEATRQAMDQEIKSLLQECYTQAIGLLQSNASLVEALVRELLQHETLDEVRIQRILNR